MINETEAALLRMDLANATSELAKMMNRMRAIVEEKRDDALEEKILLCIANEAWSTTAHLGILLCGREEELKRRFGCRRSCCATKTAEGR
ncbi:MAG: hypothetical protein HUJ63_00175 [Enterococcus sp.]|nr:hypothetical protein [Enterococcus sp.]